MDVRIIRAPIIIYINNRLQSSIGCHARRVCSGACGVGSFNFIENCATAQSFLKNTKVYKNTLEYFKRVCYNEKSKGEIDFAAKYV